MQYQEYGSIYIYGIVEGKLNSAFNSVGVGERNDKVYCVSYKDVTAIVSNTPFEEYDPTDDNAMAHENVIQEILKKNLTIAPMRFCTVVRTKNDLHKLLHSAYFPFKKNIQKIKHKLEFDVKAFLYIDKLREEVKDDEELVKRSRDIALNLNERLKKESEELKLDEQITDDMIMNASFLVHKNFLKKFYEEIVKFDKQFSHLLKIRISGPTAPYNFVNMPIR
jgi:uncharacterized membrane-anchored protein YjiN (DUF445 family)